MFRQQDYPFFVGGTIVIAGFLLIPVTWSYLLGLSFGNAVFPALISCVPFIFAFDSRGNFSLWPLIVGSVLIVLIVIRTNILGPVQQPMFLAGGIVGYGLMALGGWGGVALGRQLRAVDTDDQSDCFASLMKRTHAAWRAGSVGQSYTQQAESETLDEMTDRFFKYRRDVEAANRMRGFDSDEYLVVIGGRAFVLTNKTLYILKPLAAFSLRDIAVYSAKSHLLFFQKMSVKLESGDTFVSGPVTAPLSRSDFRKAKRRASA